MSFLTEEKRKELIKAGIKVPFVNENCIGCSACVAISPEVFDLNDEGISIVKEKDNYENNGVEDSVMACPVDAIEYE